MAIRFDAVTEDAQGLPVVSWVEDRNRFAPGGISPARVACFIRPDEKPACFSLCASVPCVTVRSRKRARGSFCFRSRKASGAAVLHP